ncbi:sigma-70 family RNA polymerase sigma factor [bacterium]|nr:sigma-70 family RNA polymerase sigma factor [bacterium]
MQRTTIDQIRNGDLDAYEAVVRQYQGMLLGYAAHRLPDINAAQEVVQLTFIRAFDQLDEFEVEREFGVWLCVICKHFILTELERQRRESRNLEKYTHSLRFRIGEAMADVQDSGRSDNLSALRQCMQNLQTQAASVVRLRYEERQSCQSIAESLGRTVTWVTSTLSRSRKVLRLCIESRLGEEAAL